MFGLRPGETWAVAVRSGKSPVVPLSYDERLGLRQAIDRATRAKWNPYSNGAEARHVVSAAERNEREEADASLVLDLLTGIGCGNGDGVAGERPAQVPGGRGPSAA